MYRLRRSASGSWAAAAALLLAAACRQSAGGPDPTIRLVQPASGPAAAYVEVGPVNAAVLGAARRLSPTSDDWARLFDVHVVDPTGGASMTAVAGKYTVDGHVLRFAPLFPFDPGRSYEVRYYATADPPGATGRVVRQTIGRPAGAPPPPTTVTHVYPSADVVPENQLRMYIHFSAPMGRRGGLAHVKLLDERGQEVADPFLPLDAEFWNADRTRYTLFFDPGRQKRGILPNRQMGPSLTAGRRYTLVVDREWIDGQGHPLAQTFTRTFRVGAPDLAALDYSKWRVTAPPQATREPLSVEFPEALDHGLLLRAIGVRRDGQALTGDVRVDAHEMRWTLTPAEAWKPGRYELIALSILEDLAGNRIGRAFEIDAFERVDEGSEPTVTSIPFQLRP